MDRRNLTLAKIHQSEMIEDARRAHLAELATAESRPARAANARQLRVALAAAALLLVTMIGLLYFTALPTLAVLRH